MTRERGVLHLGYDVGTQSTKGLVIDLERGVVVARAQSSYGLIEGLPTGAAEQHPDTWWNAIREVTAELLQQIDPSCLKGIGVSGQQHGFVPVDAAGSVICPAKLWCDTATSAEALELSGLFGRAVPTGFTASKILWLKRHEPELFERLTHVLLPHDWVNFRLSGEYFCEAGDASGTGLFDPVARSFRDGEIAQIDPDLPAMFPRIAASDAVAAQLSETAAAELGLPAGLPISPGGGDNMMSAIGAGAIEPGVTVLSLGTSGTAFAWSPEPVLDPEGLIAPFCDSTGGHLPLLCTMNVTGVTEEVRQLFDGAFSHEQLTELAAEVEPGCEGVLFLPYLQGERVPDLPHATGTLLGLRPGSLRPGLLYRAAIEGTSLGLAWGAARLAALEVRSDRVSLVGGGARNPLWRQILADLFDAEVQVLAEPESAALGAALQSAWVGAEGPVDRESLRALVSLFVQAEGEPCRPERASVAQYRDVSDRFRSAVESQFG